MFYTVGWWNQTQPIAVDLIKGDNTLSFTRYSTRELVFKEFRLSEKAPVVPKPPANYTPVPSPPSPPPGQYIEVRLVHALHHVFAKKQVFVESGRA